MIHRLSIWQRVALRTPLLLFCRRPMMRSMSPCEWQRGASEAVRGEPQSEEELLRVLLRAKHLKEESLERGPLAVAQVVQQKAAVGRLAIRALGLEKGLDVNRNRDARQPQSGPEVEQRALKCSKRGM